MHPMCDCWTDCWLCGVCWRPTWYACAAVLCSHVRPIGTVWLLRWHGLGRIQISTRKQQQQRKTTRSKASQCYSDYCRLHHTCVGLIPFFFFLIIDFVFGHPSNEQVESVSHAHTPINEPNELFRRKISIIDSYWFLLFNHLHILKLFTGSVRVRRDIAGRARICIPAEHNDYDENTQSTCMPGIKLQII